MCCKYAWYSHHLLLYTGEVNFTRIYIATTRTSKGRVELTIQDVSEVKDKGIDPSLIRIKE